MSSLIPANLATLAFLGPLYGIFLMLFLISSYGFVHRVRRRGESVFKIFTYPLFLVSVVLFVIVTMGWVIDIYRLFQAFVYYKNGTAPEEYYADPSDWPNIAILSCMLITLTAGDAVLIYRTWIIWGRQIKVTYFPLLCLVISIGLDIANIIRHAHYQTGDDLHHVLDDAFSVGPLVVSLANNISCSGMIAWRVWKQHQLSQRQTLAYNVKIILTIIMQCALIYVVWGILLIIALQTTDTYIYFFSYTYGPVSGIAFMLINVNVILGWASSRGPSQDSDATAGTAVTTLADQKGVAFGRGVRVEVDVEKAIAPAPPAKAAVAPGW